jgi:hypothetical protein
MNSKKTANTTQSTSNVLQTDNRVAAAEDSIALGAGAFLDQSFSDSSQTSLTTIDASDRSYTDSSQVSLVTQDNRAWTDNSVNYSLDAELGKVAISQAAGVAARSAELTAAAVTQSNSSSLSAMLASLRSAFGFGEAALETVRETNETAVGLVSRALETSLTDSAASREQQMGFLTSFYRDRESADSKIFSDVAKYGAAVAALGLVAYFFRRK